MLQKGHIALILISFSLLFSFDTIKAAQVESFSVAPGAIQTFYFNLDSGDVVTGSMSIAGGGDDINFWATDPSGQLIIPKQGVTGGKNFQFVAARDGAHTLHFDNSFSLIQTKAITLTYEQQYAGGGCLIATATYGSELSIPVQQLREIRDNHLLKTQSGSDFILRFNEFYYSFSPAIADLERESPIFKELVKLAITPLITSLSILNYVEIDSEAKVLGYGISLIILNLGMYVVAPMIIISKSRRYF